MVIKFTVSRRSRRNAGNLWISPAIGSGTPPRDMMIWTGGMAVPILVA
jgi:hypothetical protein